jgi:hypothetical protein
MAIVPTVVRRRLLMRANFGGGPLVKLLAFVVQPVVYLKRRSLIRGIKGSSRVWALVAVAVYSPSILQRLFGKNPEVIDVSRLGPGRTMQIATSNPLTRRARKQIVRSGGTPPTIKGDRALARLWAESNSRRAS